MEYADRGVRANAVAAGVVETETREGIVADSHATLASYEAAHPLGRFAQPRDLAEIIAFLDKPGSSFMIRVLVMADDGYTII